MTVPCDDCIYKGCGQEWKFIYSFETRCVRYTSMSEALGRKNMSESLIEQAFKAHFSVLTKESQKVLLRELVDIFNGGGEDERTEGR